jgi:uncharacterized MAPEG superfamily protein
MSIELQVLGSIGLLLLLLTLIQGTRNVIVLGLFTAAGNQHDIPAWEGWNDRLNRAIRNLIEAIAIFTPIVLAVTSLQLNNETTALGAQIFIAARALHAPLYIFGVPFLRTTAWAAGVAGIVMVASPLIG